MKLEDAAVGQTVYVTALPYLVVEVVRHGEMGTTVRPVGSRHNSFLNERTGEVVEFDAPRGITIWSNATEVTQHEQGRGEGV